MVRKSLEFTWRQMVRLPQDWGKRVEQLAEKRALPVSAMLRVLIGERLEQLEREGNEEQDQ